METPAYHPNQKKPHTVKRLPMVVFLALVLVAAWGTTVTAEFIIRHLTIPRSVAESSAITLWATNPANAVTSQTNNGITIQASNYPPVTVSQPLASTQTPQPDLQIEIESVGTLDEAGNTEKTTTLLQSLRGHVRFTVSNTGTAESKHWQFVAVLPTEPVHTEVSDRLAGLEPQESKTVTLHFDKLTPGQHTIQLRVTEDETEVDTDNNIVYIDITVL